MSIIKYNKESGSNNKNNNSSGGGVTYNGVTIAEVEDNFLPAKPIDEEKTKYGVEVEGTFKKNVTLPSITLKSADGTKTANITIDSDGIHFDKAVISNSDIVAYATGTANIKTVEELIEDYIQEHKGDFGSLSDVIIRYAGDGTVITSVDRTLSTDGKTLTLTFTKDITPATETQITNAINALDVASVGGSGKYIQSISETDGKISAVEATLNKSAVGLGNVDNTADSSKNVATAKKVTTSNSQLSHIGSEMTFNANTKYYLYLASITHSSSNANGSSLYVDLGWGTYTGQKQFSQYSFKSSDGIVAYYLTPAQSLVGGSTDNLYFAYTSSTDNVSTQADIYLVLNASTATRYYNWNITLKGNTNVTVTNNFAWTSTEPAGLTAIDKPTQLPFVGNITGNLLLNTNTHRWRIDNVDNLFRWRLAKLDDSLIGVPMYIQGADTITDSRVVINSQLRVYNKPVVDGIDVNNGSITRINELSFNNATTKMNFLKSGDTAVSQVASLGYDDSGQYVNLGTSTTSGNTRINLLNNKGQNRLMLGTNGNAYLSTAWEDDTAWSANNVYLMNNNSGYTMIATTTARNSAAAYRRIYLRPEGLTVSTNETLIDANGVNINGNSANTLVIKRTAANSGAFVNYLNNNQKVNGWRVGMNASNNYVFAYSTDSLASSATLTTIDRDGKITTIGNISSETTSTSDRYVIAKNANGEVRLYTSTNRGLYDATLSKWIIHTIKADNTVGINAGKVVVDNSGNIVAQGDVTAYSDARLKSDIKDLNNRGYLRPVEYVKDNKKSIGFIAQEVRDLYPEVVAGDEKKGYLSVNYGAITAILQKQIIEQQKQIDELRAELNKLKK